MTLPIVAYGSPILRTVSKNIDPDYPELDKFIEDMWETMYYSSGIGLAAPQVDRNIRLFIIDSTQVFTNLDQNENKEKYPDEPGIKQVFINPRLKSLGGLDWSYNEGCLSIPKIREDILRKEELVLEYEDQYFEKYTTNFNGITARVILHEYDHIEGKLFIDYLKPMKKKLLKGRLDDISKGRVDVDYKMSFPK